MTILHVEDCGSSRPPYVNAEALVGKSVKSSRKSEIFRPSTSTYSPEMSSHWSFLVIVLHFLTQTLFFLEYYYFYYVSQNTFVCSKFDFLRI